MRASRPCIALLLAVFAIPALPALPALLTAQVPKITPAGDPSVKDDTIYRLAVDPSTQSESPVRILLDDGVVRVEADGRTTRTYRMVTQLLKPEVEEDYQEQTFSWAPGHQRITINWIRVIGRNGEIISDKPSHVQDSDVPASEGDPVYSDRKVRRMSLTGVKAGTIVDWSYTVEELKPFLPGDFLLTWSVNPGAAVARSRYVVDAPASLQLRIKERNLDFERVTTVVGDRRVYTWATRDLDPIRPEPLAADSNGVYMSITISAPKTWSEIASWYAGHARSRYTLDAAASRQVDSVIAGARTRGDTIRALHRWVAQDVRYVSIALGLGGYQPRTPAEVLRTGFGDCKDKATLFIAALARHGIPAYPVLLHSGDGADRDLPSIEQFDHVIAAVKDGSDLVYTDLTADVVPYGAIPFAYQGGFGVLVNADGTGREITFPKPPLDSNRRVSVLRGSISETGMFSGTYSEEVSGAHEGPFRDNFRHPLDSATRARAATAIARNYFENAVGDSLHGFDGLDFAAHPRLTVFMRDGRAADVTASAVILRVPLQNMGTLADAARELESAKERRFPIDPEQFWGHGTASAELRMKLPPGWKAQLPKGVTAKSAFGSYHSEYQQLGDELVIRRRTAGASGIQPPEKMAEFIGWLRAVAADDARMIMLERTGMTQAGRP